MADERPVPSTRQRNGVGTAVVGCGRLAIHVSGEQRNGPQDRRPGETEDGGRRTGLIRSGVAF